MKAWDLRSRRRQTLGSIEPILPLCSVLKGWERYRHTVGLAFSVFPRGDIWTHACLNFDPGLNFGAGLKVRSLGNPARDQFILESASVNSASFSQEHNELYAPAG